VANRATNTLRLCGVTFLALLVVLPSYAAAPGQIPLAPGKPAGVEHAQMWSAKTLGVIAGGTAAVVGFALLISTGTSVVKPIAGGNGNSVVFSPTTTSTK
jgi:hypothetical protein